jgi:hypothetical protein
VITADAEFPAAALSDSNTLCLCSPKPWATRTLTGLSISAGRQFTFRRDFDVAHTHVTASTQLVEANGLRFAYRRFGQKSGIPLLFLQHFRGGMDHWDPAVTDGFAECRRREFERGNPEHDRGNGGRCRCICAQVEAFAGRPPWIFDRRVCLASPEM